MNTNQNRPKENMVPVASISYLHFAYASSPHSANRRVRRLGIDVTWQRLIVVAFVFLAALLFQQMAVAQVCTIPPGATGPAAVPALPNSYFPGSGSALAGTKTINIGSINPSGSNIPIAVGDLILVIQMQDASFNSANSGSYGGSGTGQGYTSLNNAGAYEYATVTAVGPGSVVVLSNLINNYANAPANSGMGQRTFQVIRVPQYSSATLSGTVSAAPWDGASGGIVAIDVAGQLNWSGGTIDVAARGFRGGGGQASGSNGTGDTLATIDYVSRIGAGTINTSVPNGAKGEGIAGTPILVFAPSAPLASPTYINAAGTSTLAAGTDGTSAGYPKGSFARGAPGNGGGGGTDGDTAGNSQNSGGGGGGSYGDGGTGGYGWTPGTPPGSQTGGTGGGAVPSSATRLFMGGGGGAGSTNNSTGTPGSGIASSGSAGGGMVFVRAGSTLGTAAINAQGGNANNTVTNDASGGGGGGGQILVFINNAGGAVSANINVNGGNGGTNTGGGSPHGPGGGGSGGFAALSGTPTSISFSGGTNGTTATSPTSTADYGSTSSPGGTQIVNLPATIIPGVSPSSTCLPQLSVVKTTSTPNSVASGTATYTTTITNLTGKGTATGVIINDPLSPTNAFTYASTPSVTLGGGATRPVITTPTLGATAPAWGTFTMPGGSSVAVTFTVNVPPAVAPGTYNNNANVVYDDPTRTMAGQTVTPGGTYASGGTAPGSNYVGTLGGNTGEDVTIRSPLTVVKSFSPTSISANGTSVLQVVVNNPNTIALTNISLTDTYPSGLVNAASPSASSNCGGTFVAAAAGTSFLFSGGAIAASGSCTLQLSVTSATAATYDNIIPAFAVTSAQNVSNAASATGTLFGTPTIAKAFSPTAVAPNTNATLTFTVANPNTVQALSGIAFTDTFPTNLVVATPLTVGGTCLGVATSGTTVAGGGVFNVTAGNIPANGNCTITVQVRSAVTGTYLNTAGGVTSTQTPTVGSPSNTAGLGVGLITISKVIAPALVAPGQQATVTLKLSNPTGVAQTNATFSDVLSNMAIDIGQTATVGGSAGCSGSAVLTAGQTTLNFTGINIPAVPAVDTCTVTFTVSSVQVGTNPNTASGVSTALLPVGPPSNTANLVVVTKPTISKAFVPSSIQPGNVSQLSFTINNLSTIPLTGIAFTDTYPTNVINATPLTVGGTCTGVTTTSTVAGGNAINVNAGTVPASASCTITVAVTSNIVGTYNNTGSGVATTQTGTAGAASNTATLSVVSPATISKAFAPTPIAQGATSVITFTIRNLNGVALTNLNFADSLANMTVASATIGGTCGATNSPVLTIGATSLNMNIVSLAGGAQCTVTVTVTSSNPGSNPNTSGGVSSTEAPTAGSPSNTATLDVLASPGLQKAFVPNDIPLGTTTTMTITVRNPNAVALTNVTFTDALSNMTVNATSASTTCGVGVGGLSFSPALTLGGTAFNPTLTSLAANEVCTISVQIKSTVISPGAGHVNTTGGATSTQTSVVPGPTASANLVVTGPPTIAKQFVRTASLPAVVAETPLQVGAARATTIIFILTNPNGNVLTGASFSDTFPTGMTTTGAVQNYIGAGRGTCTGAIPSAGSTTVGVVTFSGINIPANGSCTVFVDVTVTATSAGTVVNNVSGVTTLQTPTAGTGASATLTALAPPTITKAFSPTGTVGGAANPVTLTLTITNPNATPLTGVSVTDTFPTNNGGMVANSTVVTPATPCGAGSTVTDNLGAALVAGTSLGIRLNGGTLAANATCTFSIPVQITTGANAAYTNTTGGVTSNETPAAGTTASDTLNRFVTARITIAKSFSTPVVQTNSSGQSNLILTISNNTGATRTINASALDTFPTAPSAMTAVGGLTITGGAGCLMTPNTIAANATNYSLTGGTITDLTTCIITIPIKVGATAGTYANTVAGVAATGLTTGVGDSANLIAVAAPTIAKAFAPATIGIGGVSTITFTVTNSSTTTALTNATFTDTLTSMTVATAGAAGGTCGGAASNTYTAGQTGAITVTGLTLPVNASCTITLNVTSSTVSLALPNTTSGVTTTQTPTAGAVSNTANLAVVQASINKAFAPAAIDVGGTSVLTFTITNGAGNPVQTSIGFVDTLPTNVLVASTPSATTTCPAGTIGASAGSGVISFTVGTMNSGQASCTVTVNVTSNVAGGPYNNTSANVATTNLTNSVSSSGLTVAALPTLTKAFNVATIGVGGTAVLTFTITNNGTGNIARAGLNFTDTLPSGLIIAATPGVTSNCPAGGAQAAAAFVAAAAGSSTITTTAAAVNAGVTCSINVNVTNVSSMLGACPNAALTNGQGNISGLSSGASGITIGSMTNQCVSVLGTTLTKTFTSATIQAGATSTLTFTLTNGAGNPAQTGLSFIDALPSGVVVAGTPNLRSNCPAGGALVNNPAFLTAPAAGGTITVSAAAAMTSGVASCTILVDVTAAAQGTYLNNAARISGLSASGAIDASGVNASLTALSLPLITKAFSPSTINADGTSTMTFTVTNNNSVSLTGGSFTDTLTNIRVSGLQSPPGGTCGATGSYADQQTGALSFTIPSVASGTCTISLLVTSDTPGVLPNTTSAISFTGPLALSSASGSNTANLTVVGVSPTIAKAFSPSTIPDDGVTASTVTLTLANTNGIALTGASFTDTLSNMSVAGAQAAGGTCTGAASNSLTNNQTAIFITGLTILANSSCTITFTVKSTIAGVQPNTTSGITTTQTPTPGTVSNTANLTVQSRPSLTKAFGTTNIVLNGTTTLIFTIANTGTGNIARTGQSFTDTLQAGLQIVNPAVPSSVSCGIPVFTAVNATQPFVASSVDIAAGATCTITLTVRGVTAGVRTNGAADITAISSLLANGVTTQTVNVYAPPSITKTFTPASIGVGGTSSMVITVTNPAANPGSLTGVTINDAYTGTLTNNAAGSLVCSGAGTATLTGGINAGTSVGFNAATIVAGGTCTITQSVTATTTNANITTAPSATGPVALTGAAANATLTINQASVAKTFGAASINDGTTTSLIFTLTNSAGSPAQSGISLGDTLPSGLTINTATPAVTYSAGCSGPATAAFASGTGILSGLSGIAMTNGTASCTITVAGVTNKATQTGTCPQAAQTNLAASVTATNASPGVANACLSVTTIAPVLTKAFTPNTFVDGATSTLRFTITNSGTNPAQTGINFTDNLPSSLRVAVGGVLGSSTCTNAATVTAAASGSTTVVVTGATMPVSQTSCVIDVQVRNVAGQVNASCVANPAAFTNTNANITGTANLTNSVTASCVTVTTASPTIAKAFSPTTIAANGTSTITFTITNPNSIALTSANFADTLNNIRISGAQNAAGTCLGANTNSYTANQTGLLNVAGLTIPASGSCNVTILVASNTPGVLPNTTTGVASAEAATGVVSNTATLTVTAVAPTISKTFVTPTIAIGGTSQIDFTIINTNSAALTGAAFSDTLSNMFVSTTGAATGTCTGAGSNSYTANQTGLINISGLTIPGNGNCTISITVKSNTPGVLPNTATGVSSNEAVTGAPSNIANLTVTAAAPTIAKAFAPATIASGGTSTLTITITNPNNGPITVASVTDTFPTTPGTGMLRAITPAISTSCTGGAVTSSVGSVTLTGGTVPANGVCTFQIDVTAATAGSYNNNIAIGALTTNAGSNAAAANATLTVTPIANVSVTKLGPTTIPWGTTITYTSTVTNAGPDAANLTVFADQVPAAISGVSAVCGAPTNGAVCGTVNVTGNNVSSTITTLPAGGTVTFTIQGTAPQTGTLANAATAIVPMGITDPDDPGRTGAGNNTSSTVNTVVQAPDLAITKTASTSSFTVGTNASFTLTPNNLLGNAATVGTITVADTLAAGLTYVPAGSGGTGWICNAAGQVITCTSTNVINAGATGNPITINVSVAANAAPAITNTATVAGGNEPPVNTGNNSATVNVNVNNTPISTFTTDGAQTSTPGSAVFYPHTFTAGSAGAVSFSTVSTPIPNISGWGVTVFRDPNCDGVLTGTEGSTPLTTSVPVLAGDQVCIVIKSAIPNTAPYNATDSILVTATFTPSSGPVVMLSHQDITTVGAAAGSGLVLTKAVRNITQGGALGTTNSAKPGDVLEYVITYTNSSNTALSMIIISDNTPAFTAFLLASCGSLPMNITGCSATVQPMVGAAGNVQWTLVGSLNAMQSGSVVFRVTVQ